MKRVLSGFVALLLLPSVVQAQGAAKYSVIANSKHSRVINSVAFAPNGKWFASASDDGTIKLWATANGRLLRTLKGHSAEIFAVAVAPDGKTILSLSGDKTIRVWQADDGHILRTISDLTGAGLDPLQNSFAISHDGRWAYVTSFNAIKRIEIDSGKIRKSYTKRNFFRWETVAISPDGHLLAAAHSAGVGSPLSEQNSSYVELLDTESGRVVNQLGKFSKNENVNSLAYAADGRTVLAMGRRRRDQGVGCENWKAALRDQSLEPSAEQHTFRSRFVPEFSGTCNISGQSRRQAVGPGHRHAYTRYCRDSAKDERTSVRFHFGARFLSGRHHACILEQCEHFVR